jgi:hypothetical protein
MNQQVAKQSYRGVLCMSCRQPIPLPATLVSLELMPEKDEAGRPVAHHERVFSLRCRACNREKPYRSSDIIEFDGTPRSRASYFHRPPKMEGRVPLSRAANG